MIFWDLHFLNSVFIYLIPVVIILFFTSYYFVARKTKLEISFYDDLKKVYKFSSIFSYLRLALMSLIIIVFFLLFANPNKVNVEQKINKNGIDIVLALDVSKSMESEDLKPTRMEAAKKVIENFLWQIKTDRVWLVIFAWKPFSSAPMTFDYNLLKQNLDSLTTDSLNQNVSWLNWTAIWDALLLSKNLFRLEDEENKGREKVVILLTDWDANKWVEPKLAAEVLKESNIKIYTVWIWSKEGWYINYQMWLFQQRQEIPPLKEDELRNIASISSWEFFRATDNDSLENIFKELENLTKTDVEVSIKKSFDTYYKPFLYTLLVLIFSLIVLEFYIYRR